MARIVRSLTALVLLATPAAAADRDQAARAAYAAFQCAELARLVIDSDGLQQRKRLLNWGVAQSRIAGPEAMDPGGVPQEWLGGVSPDFWTGFVLAQAMDDVETELAEQVPRDDSNNPGKRFATKQDFAAEEFTRRNCALLGL